MTGTAESQTLNELLQRLRTHLPDSAARYQIASLGACGGSSSLAATWTSWSSSWNRQAYSTSSGWRTNLSTCYCQAYRDGIARGEPGGRVWMRKCWG